MLQKFKSKYALYCVSFGKKVVKFAELRSPVAYLGYPALWGKKYCCAPFKKTYSVWIKK